MQTLKSSMTSCLVLISFCFYFFVFPVTLVTAIGDCLYYVELGKNHSDRKRFPRFEQTMLKGLCNL